MKIMKNWCEVPVEQYETLKKQILQAIINYALGPKIVLNRLCIAVSIFLKFIVKLLCYSHFGCLNVLICLEM